MDKFDKKMFRIIKSWPVKWRYIDIQCMSFMNIIQTFREHHWSKLEDVAPSVDVTIATHWRPYVFSQCSHHHSTWDRKQWFLPDWPCEERARRRWWAGFVGWRTTLPFTVQTKVLVQDEFQHLTQTCPVSQRHHWAVRASDDLQVLLWFSQRWREQHTTLRRRLRQSVMVWFARPPSEEWGPQRRRVAVTSWGAFLRWTRKEEAALAAADGRLQCECCLTLQTGTTWYYNNKDTVWNTAEGQRTERSLSLQAGGLSHQVHFQSQAPLMDGNLCRFQRSCNTQLHGFRNFITRPSFFNDVLQIKVF